MANTKSRKHGTRRQEDCLEALHELSEQGPARLTALSRRLGISKPSASACLDRLERSGLVTHDRYSHFTLTGRGARIARGMRRTHALLASFLSGTLGVPAARADAEACALEHAFKPATLERLRRFMASRGKKK